MKQTLIDFANICQLMTLQITASRMMHLAERLELQIGKGCNSHKSFVSAGHQSAPPKIERSRDYASRGFGLDSHVVELLRHAVAQNVSDDLTLDISLALRGYCFEMAYSEERYMKMLSEIFILNKWDDHFTRDCLEPGSREIIGLRYREYNLE